MLILEHEYEDHKEEKTCFSQEDNVLVADIFYIFSIRKGVFHAVVCLLSFVLFLVSHMHGRKNHFVRKGSYLNKTINRFV